MIRGLCIPLLVVAAVALLSAPSAAQDGLPGGERDYGRHLRTLLADESEPTWELAKAGKAEEVAAQIAAVLIDVLGAYPDCLALNNPEWEPLACVSSAAMERMPPELERTGLPNYCAQSHVDSAWQYAGCLYGAWDDAVNLMQEAGKQAETYHACSPEERVAAMTLSLVRMTRAFIWSKEIDQAATKVEDPSLGYYFTGRESEILSSQMDSHAKRIREFLQDMYVTYARLDSDPDRSKVSTLLLLSTLRQQYARCLQRHPEREVYFERLEAPARAPASDAAEPLVVWVRDASPIDLRRAAQRRLDALTGAHRMQPTKAAEALDTGNEEPMADPAAVCRANALAEIEAEPDSHDSPEARWRYESLRKFEASTWGQTVARAACWEQNNQPLEPNPDAEFFADMNEFTAGMQAQRLAERSAERKQQLRERFALQVLSAGLLHLIPSRSPGKQAASTFVPDGNDKIAVLKGIDSAYLLVKDHDYGLSDFVRSISQELATGEVSLGADQ